ncbi:hypothetical protein GTC3P0254_00810 [Burkholderia pseudomallei]|nr:hypothetical protein GTC019_26460 [Burkholderia pseudomallei]BEH37517.1 hypothetical protein GTC254T_26120 [Burkholderia pseudomallei]BEH55435.1 hypothetical protein BpKM376_26140 [Burkholderia pseudomallei]BEH67583.1 hypothetical protein BpKM391_26580 [Burkholderia pseudomallei]GEA53104.1 hypothetical protein GTC3P0254_00810 [Burkholderia pseudomallei]
MEFHGSGGLARVADETAMQGDGGRSARREVSIVREPSSGRRTRRRTHGYIAGSTRSDGGIAMQRDRHTRWLLTSDDIRKDAPFFGTLGVLIGVAQLVGFRCFHKADWGTKLLFEHIVFDTLIVALIVVWLARIPTEWLRIERKREFPMLDKLIAHVARRAASFAVTAASVVAGVAAVAALSGSPVHAVKFAFFCAYLLSIGEAVLNPLIAPGQSRLNGVAKALLIGMPLGFQLTG